MFHRVSRRVMKPQQPVLCDFGARVHRPPGAGGSGEREARVRVHVRGLGWVGPQRLPGPRLEPLRACEARPRRRPQSRWESAVRVPVLKVLLPVDLLTVSLQVCPAPWDRGAPRSYL